LNFMKAFMVLLFNEFLFNTKRTFSKEIKNRALFPEIYN